MNIRRWFSVLGILVLAIVTCVSDISLAQSDEKVSIREEIKDRTSVDVDAAGGPAFGEREIARALTYRVADAAPVSPYYMLGPNDEIIINLWGKRTQTLKPTVDKDGFILFRLDAADVRISVNGIFFKDIRQRIVNELSKLTSDIDPEHPESSAILVDVTLGAIRGMNVMVFGEVRNPGQYTLNTTIASAFNVLAAAGGITPQGSLRNILVRRPGGSVSSVDLYALDIYAVLSSGELREELLHLHDGDIMVVPPKKRIVTFSGEIKRVGTYEIKADEKLGSLIELVGGLTADADPTKIKILRVNGVDKAQFHQIDFASDSDFVLKDGDQIDVPAKPETRRLNAVDIKGDGVRQPGRYPYTDNMTVRDLISAAGGLYEDAMLQDAVLVRTRQDYSLEFSTIDIDNNQSPDNKEPMVLNALDLLIIYSRFNKEGGEKHVTVLGHVKEPGEYLLSARMTLADLVFMAGGFSDPDFLRETWLDRLDITRIDPVTQHKKILSVSLQDILDGKEEANMLLQSKDMIRVYAFDEMNDSRYASIDGEVRIAGTYEITQGMTLADLLGRANGITDLADPERVEIARFPDVAAADAADAEVIICSVTGSGAAITIHPNDKVVVRRKAELREKGTVFLSGEVRYPGTYVLLNRTETVSDLISRSGDLLEGAAPDAARVYRRRESDPSSGTNQSEAVPGLPVAVNVARGIEEPHGDYDLLLLDGDRLHIPKQNWTVQVAGDVMFPKTVQCVKGRSPSHYIRLAGGCTSQAHESLTVIIYPNGEVKRARRMWFFSRRVTPGCIIYVPPRTGQASPDFCATPLNAAPAAPTGSSGKTFRAVTSHAGEASSGHGPASSAPDLDVRSVRKEAP
jgi:protein involved in polysaccharide export with SLBB domain